MSDPGAPRRRLRPRIESFSHRTVGWRRYLLYLAWIGTIAIAGVLLAQYVAVPVANGIIGLIATACL